MVWEEKNIFQRNSAMCVGDVVWGKAEGNPWWPGKVLAKSRYVCKILSCFLIGFESHDD